jgi:hypothetical protein
MIVAEPKCRWLVTCSCGLARECSSEWAARSVSTHHPQLGRMDVAHPELKGLTGVQAGGSNAPGERFCHSAVNATF